MIGVKQSYIVHRAGYQAIKRKEKRQAEICAASNQLRADPALRKATILALINSSEKEEDLKDQIGA